MRVIPTQYEAFDGTIFDDGEDCQAYEQECLIANSTFKMYDDKFNPTKEIEKVYYVYFPNPKEINTFNKLHYDYGYAPIQEWDKNITDVIYYYCYDENGWKWKQLDEEIKKLQHIKNTLISKNF